MSTSNTTPAGWYPNPAPGAEPNTEMYYDGHVWRDDLVRAAGAPMTEVIPTVAPTAKRPWFKRKRIIIPAAAVVGIILISAIANGGSADEEPAASAPLTSEVAEEAPVEEAPEVVEAIVPNVLGMTVADAAAEYESAGFVLVPIYLDGENPAAVATFARTAAGQSFEVGAELSVEFAVPEVAHPSLAHEMAIKEAESYLSVMSFSRQGLLDQLTSEYGGQFPLDQAEYGVAYLEANGLVDWNAEAVQEAQSYLNTMSFSRQGLYDQMTSEYGGQFTHEQTEHALNTVGL